MEEKEKPSNTSPRTLKVEEETPKDDNLNLQGCEYQKIWIKAENKNDSPHQETNEVLSCEVQKELGSIEKSGILTKNSWEIEANVLKTKIEVTEGDWDDSKVGESIGREDKTDEQQNIGAILHSSKAGEAHWGLNSDSKPTEENTNLIRKETSKLQFLLSQSDIFEYLRKLHNGELNEEEVKMAKSSNIIMEARKATISNKRHLKEGDEEENSNSKDGYDNEKVIEKIEVQPPTIVYGKMRSYQLDALNWLNSLHEAKLNGILADEMGLGKTIESISILALIESRRSEQEKLKRKSFHLVIVPKVTLNKWKKEFQNWLPSLRVFKFYGSQEEKEAMKAKELKERKFDCILTTYEVIIKEKAALQKFKYEYLILDEAHRIKNDQWVLSQILRKFNTEHRLLLTGTPLQNNLKELWALLNFLMPNLFDSEEEFSELFEHDQNDPNSQKLIIKQIHRLLRPFMLRRLKWDVEKSLPPKNEIYLYFGMSEMQKKLYKQILTKNIDVVNGAGDRLRLLNVLMQLRKWCNHPYLFSGMEPGPPYSDGPHLFENCMKFKVLDALLK